MHKPQRRFLYNHFLRYILAIFPRLQYTEFGSAENPESMKDIIDNAPDINISTINALVASNTVMVPITIDDFAIDGLAELKEQISNTKEDLNPDLRFMGCFITQFDRTNEADLQGEEFLKMQDCNLFETHIRRTPKMKPSTFAREPIIEYSARCGASLDYKKLVEEYLKKLSENVTE